MPLATRTLLKNSIPINRVQLSSEKVLSMLVETQLTRDQYNIRRSNDIARFPSYKTIKQDKTDCYHHKKEHFIVTECSAKIGLQGLLDHTACRLMLAQHEVIISQKDLHRVTLLSTWEFDSLSGYLEYKQNYLNTKYNINKALFKPYALEKDVLQLFEAPISVNILNTSEELELYSSDSSD
ncbi:hypothetical protein ILUMI_19731 [Ignelater luminosus]|uniref:Uncharacterized protein n=1 Tax=Ignelater luminosus TaxID=2038154 RepID=A0A8K0CJK6_IGNLU|nr:hypothetical protein ILUMI_19731 [Ignelater luminosus]